MSLSIFNPKDLSDLEINSVLEKILKKNKSARSPADIINLCKLTKEWLERYDGLYPPCYSKIIDKERIISWKDLNDKKQ